MNAYIIRTEEITNGTVSSGSEGAVIKMAEKEYLSREDVLGAVDAIWQANKNGSHGDPILYDALDTVARVIEVLPAADVAPVVRGYLTGEGYFDELYCEFGTCSVCGENNPIGINFCGNCGAKLDKSRKRNGENETYKNEAQ